jgi:hypothetical protein
VTINPTSASNTAPRRLPRISHQRDPPNIAREKVSAHKATNDKCVKQTLRPRVLCNWGAQTSSDASAVFIAINARLRATLFKQSYTCVDQGSITAARRWDTSCEVGQHPSAVTAALSTIPRAPPGPGHALCTQDTQHNDTTARTGLLPAFFVSPLPFPAPFRLCDYTPVLSAPSAICIVA